MLGHVLTARALRVVRTLKKKNKKKDFGLLRGEERPLGFALPGVVVRAWGLSSGGFGEPEGGKRGWGVGWGWRKSEEWGEKAGGAWLGEG